MKNNQTPLKSKSYLIFHTFQFQVDESSAFLVKIFREVFGDVLRQCRKGLGAQGIQRRPFKRCIVKEPKLSLKNTH